MKNFIISRHFFTITPPLPVQVFVSDLKKQVREAIGHIPRPVSPQTEIK